jgi:hypothetical protein
MNTAKPASASSRALPRREELLVHRMVFVQRHPTIRRENTSETNAANTIPDLQAHRPAVGDLPDTAETIEATFWDRQKVRGVYGARKMWHQLRRDRVTGAGGRPIAVPQRPAAKPRVDG